MIRVLLRSLALGSIAAAVLALSTIGIRSRSRTLIWGIIPLINYKYWSAAQQAAGRDSRTLVTHLYAIYRREDFDLHVDDFAPPWLPGAIGRLAGACAAFWYVLRNASVLHVPFSGGFLGDTYFWRLEAPLLRRAGIKTVVITYGADAFLLSSLTSATLKHALLSNYPELGTKEGSVRTRVQYWCRHADCVLCGFMTEGLPRWDVTIPNMLCLPTETWPVKPIAPGGDGRTGRVRILHAPNHRGAKGTEFIVGAVNQLRDSGLDVELVLAERMPNEKVREELLRCDILADQVAYGSGYGLNAIEGLVSGLPVVTNLENEVHLDLFRRYAYFDECPVVHASPETVRDVLGTLVRDPELRLQLGRAGRAYADKYHSLAMAQHLFGSIYRRILDGQDIDLMNLFHPLKSDYVRSKPKVSHPLRRNRLRGAA